MSTFTDINELTFTYRKLGESLSKTRSSRLSSSRSFASLSDDLVGLDSCCLMKCWISHLDLCQVDSLGILMQSYHKAKSLISSAIAEGRVPAPSGTIDLMSPSSSKHSVGTGFPSS